MSNDASHAQRQDARATLDAWRACGADRLNPVRFHFMEALDRRSAAYTGPARKILDDQLAKLLQAYEADLSRAANQSEPAILPASGNAGPLAELIDDIANPAPGIGRDPMGLRAAYPEAQMLDYFRTVWSRVSADRQVRQSQEQVHKNAGPLNSNQLVHRALSLMRGVSPGYLQQFLSYTDALIWMEQLTGSATAAKEAPRAGAAKKTNRAKAR